MTKENSKLNTVSSLSLSKDDFQNYEYHFQPFLTDKLDKTEADFNQDIINEIVLWKVNRFAQVNDSTLDALNVIHKKETSINIEITRNVLHALLNTKGIQLAMASTILRFKNPNVYQIIDQRVYRFIYGENMPTYFSSINSQIEIYIKYLEKLREVCIINNIDFKLSDRILYALDKKHNKNISIKY